MMFFIFVFFGFLTAETWSLSGKVKFTTFFSFISVMSDTYPNVHFQGLDRGMGEGTPAEVKTGGNYSIY